MKNRGFLQHVFLLISMSVMLSHCKKDEQTPQPSINSFVPTSGFAGESVTISANNLSDNKSEITAEFNGTSAVINSSSTTQLVLTVPSGATTGKITITVNGKSAISDSDFTVLLPQTITSFNPSSGLAGSSVTITGSGFKTTLVDNIVKVNGVTATVTAATATSLTVTIPDAATTGKITVTINGHTEISASDFIVLHPQTITSFNPTAGQVGSSVTITGENFSTTATDNVVKFNGIPGTVTAATSTSLTATIPVGATTGKISVTLNGNSVASNLDFTVLPPQTITSFDPISGQSGTTVIITGTNFSSTTTDNVVKFNGTAATVTAATSTSLTVTIPVGATPGKISVTISGNTVSSVNDFQVIIDVPRNGLIAFYPFTGNPNDVSGSNAHGTLQIQNGSGGAAPSLFTDRFGVANHSYLFDGIGSYITVGNPTPLQVTGPITVAGWFYSKSNTTTGVGGIYHSQEMISKIFSDPTAGNNPKGGFTLRHQGSAVTFYPSYGGSNNSISYDPIVDLNTWVFVAAVMDGTGYTLYKNGQVVSHVTGNATTDSRGDLFIGTYGGGFLFSGMIDDVTLYSRALTATEITQLYQQNITK